MSNTELDQDTEELLELPYVSEKIKRCEQAESSDEIMSIDSF